ncbi:hypothetical protein ABB37_02987 [Leptomonas pyrrhocoris]|uniref:Uncharacterized protein n=1 Tax=Leptomonas pyrrhocoris TaxID=157538 RepID=A0A0N0DXT9_LEPPY|nr:hypothetical protein ABB37_02987 [Leptomonas pyrrhocoris]XP_015661770.1 hypothetical protein ABB37_02987 [Leptomonas pyrrhocoris]KPA83330.1 hypothetical protein ABB37_02987 [Leptomonas pyrrhocoris]KPA83331.1 hypothetical protein ABB37_02987 [Leptomonas pyrrhocoris]|eukprot:XP_015661769.1 hypothetical protein ABB37_02987 [Leptomonas pyrrhocoris]
MANVEPSADSYVCHVADAPTSHQHKRGSADDFVISADAYLLPPPSHDASHRYSSPHALTETSPTSLPGAHEPEHPQPATYVSNALRVQHLEELDERTADNSAVGRASLLAVESCPPSSRASPQQQSGPRHNLSQARPNVKAGNKRDDVAAPTGRAAPTAPAADALMTAFATDILEDDVASPDHPTSLTSEGLSASKGRTTKKPTIDAEEYPRPLSHPAEDRVRGYSMTQVPSSAEDGSSTSGYEDVRPQLLPPIVHAVPPCSGAAEIGNDKNSPASSTPHGRSPASLTRGENAPYTTRESDALVTAESEDSSSLTTYGGENSMRELVSHVDHDSFGFELREALQAIDFAAVLDEYRRNSSVESNALHDCRRLFRVLSMRKDALSAEDVYDLLVLFTPCGAAFREGVDFLWENCEGKSSLSFENFLLYGPRLRARLHGYELFSKLTDHDKLIVTHRRVLPAAPSVEANVARLQLLQLAEEQLQGNMRPQSRPFRLYEEIFLVEYQNFLSELALIPTGDVPQWVPDGDFAHEQRQTLPQLSMPLLQKESMGWGADGREACNDDGGDHEGLYAASAGPADDRPFVVPYSESEAAPSATSPVYRDANSSGRGLQSPRAREKPSGRRPSPGMKGAATSRKTKTWDGTGNPFGSRTARHGKSLAVTMQGRPRTDMRKNLGRFVEEEYWERRTLDDYLITQLQEMYSTE